MGIDLNALLENMAKEGTKDSTGNFSVDIARAHHKIAQFTLPDSRGYILKLVQAAVAGQAMEFRLTSGNREVLIQFTGLQLDLQNLETLLWQLAERGKNLPASSYHLAIGIRAALGLEAERIEIESSDRLHRKLIVWTNEKIECQVQATTTPYVTSLKLVRTQSRVWKEWMSTLYKRNVFGMLWGWRSGYDEERTLVSDICCLAPLPIYINGQRCQRLEVIPKPARAYSAVNYQRCFLVPRESSGDEPRGFLAPRQISSATVQALAPPRYTGFGVLKLAELPNFDTNDHHEYEILLAIHPTIPESQIMVILDGVLVHRRSTSGPGFTAILNSRGLSSDLTGMRLIENEEFEKRCQLLADLAESARTF